MPVNSQHPSDPATRRLLAAAEFLSEGGERADFERAYRAWITTHHSVEGAIPDERQDKVRLLLLAMLNGRDLGDALGIMLRFGQHAIGVLNPVAIDEAGGNVAIRMERERAHDTAGLIGELWSLSFHRAQLEFLTGRALSGISGTVRQDAMLPPHVEQLLFDPPVIHGARHLSLVLPREHLRLPIVVQAPQVSGFIHRLLPTSTGTSRDSIEYASVVEAILRVETMRGAGHTIDQKAIAERIGCSVATLRRRLSEEGPSFRSIQERLTNEAAKRLLVDEKIPIARIAERLGYGDGYSFRRAFHRSNRCSPSEYRRKHKHGT